MARMPRVIIPGYPHHIVQRGSRRQTVFFTANDRKLYIRLLYNAAVRFGIELWAYCLMENHVHLIAVPKEMQSLECGVGEAHREYSRRINSREGWRGHLWQERFFSCPLDRPYLYAAVRYVELNPVRAGIVQEADEYPWSSAYSHINKIQNKLLSDQVLVEEIGDWKAYLSVCDNDLLINKIRKHVTTGRPLGNDLFINKIEQLEDRTIRKKKSCLLDTI